MKANRHSARKLYYFVKTPLIGVFLVSIASSCGDNKESSDDATKKLAMEVARVVAQTMESKEPNPEQITQKYRARAKIFAHVFREEGMAFGGTTTKPSSKDSKEEEVKSSHQNAKEQPTPFAGDPKASQPSTMPEPKFPKPESDAKVPNAPPPPPPPMGAPRGSRPAGLPPWAKMDPSLFDGFSVAGKDVTSAKANQLRSYLGEVERAPERFDSLFAYFGLRKKPDHETPAEKIVRERQVFYFGPPLLALDGTEIDATTTETTEGRRKFWQTIFSGPSPLAKSAGSRMPLDRISELTTRVNPTAVNGSKSIVITNMKPFVRLMVLDKSDTGDGPDFLAMKELSENLADSIGGNGGIGAGAQDAARGGVWFWFRKNAPPLTGETQGQMRNRFDAMYDEFLMNESDGESFQEWYPGKVMRDAWSWFKDDANVSSLSGESLEEKRHRFEAAYAMYQSATAQGAKQSFQEWFKSRS